MDGTHFGRYRLERLIGEGGMGQVYRAYDTEKNRTVALKVLPEHAAGHRDYQERFRREAHAAAGLREPHIVPIHDYGEIDGRLFLDMRLIEGTDLKTLLARHGPMPAAMAVTVVDQVAAALDAAHAAGLIHRDVKPSNILVAARSFVYLIDFGIARAAGDVGLTSTGSTIGTLAYMAPERFTTGATDARADVYALACVLYECLTGVQPYPGESLEQQIAAHLTVPPPQPSRTRDMVSAGFDQVIARGMAKDPTARYPSAGGFAAAAHWALGPGTPQPKPPVETPLGQQTLAYTVQTGHRPQHTTPVPSSVPGPTLTDPYSGPPAGIAHAAPSVRRPAKQVVLLVAIVILAVAVAAAGYVAVASRTTDSASSQPFSSATVPASASEPSTAKEVPSNAAWPGPLSMGLAPSPELPQSLPQWALQNTWNLTSRAFADQWSTAPGPGHGRFPATMNGCNNHRFLVRWRVVNPNATVIATNLNAVDSPGEQVTGTAGWMDLDGCHTPAFQFSASTNASNLTDVAIAIAQWQPAP
ncbi:protein kinase [Rhodococcus sp. NPDC057014]|uniref:serine/threonine-protein kinase n=1 Tax=Rhodococcus sp. NPDC057014 TaxID=3346000 RepID=UPI003634B984